MQAASKFPDDLLYLLQITFSHLVLYHGNGGKENMVDNIQPTKLIDPRIGSHLHRIKHSRGFIGILGRPLGVDDQDLFALEKRDCLLYTSPSPRD